MGPNNKIIRNDFTPSWEKNKSLVIQDNDALVDGSLVTLTIASDNAGVGAVAYVEIDQGPKFGQACLSLNLLEVRAAIVALQGLVEDYCAP